MHLRYQCIICDKVFKENEREEHLKEHFDQYFDLVSVYRTIVEPDHDTFDKLVNEHLADMQAKGLEIAMFNVDSNDRSQTYTAFILAEKPKKKG